jgi:hypothetical protein
LHKENLLWGRQFAALAPKFLGHNKGINSTALAFDLVDAFHAKWHTIGTDCVGTFVVAVQCPVLFKDLALDIRAEDGFLCNVHPVVGRFPQVGSLPILDKRLFGILKALAPLEGKNPSRLDVVKVAQHSIRRSIVDLTTSDGKDMVLGFVGPGRADGRGRLGTRLVAHLRFYETDANNRKLRGIFAISRVIFSF